MALLSKIRDFYIFAKGNRWMIYFTLFCRISLAAGFLPAGFVKVNGERFTDLSNNQPMGHYLEALYHTGYYYTVIGVLQMLAGALLLLPRVWLLGALLYFPIILNITILSFSVRFEGSLLTSPLMVLANIYLLCWNYDRLRYILPLNNATPVLPLAKHNVLSNQFPFEFAASVFAVVVIVTATVLNLYDILPRNTLPGCMSQCKNNENPKACAAFCNSIHTEGKPFDKVLAEYHKALKETARTK